MTKRFLTHAQLEEAVQQAENEWKRGNWRQAVSSYCEIFLSRWKDLDEQEDRLTPADLTILERIADFAAPLGLHEESDQALSLAMKGYQRLADHYWYNRICLKRIHLALNAGQVDAAYDQLEQCIGSKDFSYSSIGQWIATWPYKQAERDELAAQLWLEMGRLMHLQGSNKKSLFCLNKGLFFRGASTACKLHLCLQITQCRIELAEFAKALHQLDDLKKSLDPLRFPAQVTRWHECSAKIHLLKGNFAAALIDLQSVWRICEQLGFAAPILNAALNLAQVLLIVNQNIEATNILNRLRNIAVSRQQHDLIPRIQRLLDLSQVRRYGAAGRGASVHDEQSATEQTKTPTPSWPSQDAALGYTLAHFEERALSFQWYLGLQQWETANKVLDRLHYFQWTDGKIVHARLCAMAATLSYYTAHASQAGEQLRAARDTFLKLGLLPEQWQIQTLLVRYLLSSENAAPEREEMGQQNDALLENMSHSLPMAMRVNFLLDKATYQDEKFAAKVREIHQTQLGIAGKSFPARQLLRFKIARQIAALLDEAYWQKEAHAAGLLDNDQPANVAPVHKSFWRRLFFHNPVEATLIFLVLPDSAVVICRKWGAFELKVCPFDKLHLRSQLGDLHESIRESSPEQTIAILRLLADQLQLNSLVLSLPRYIKKMRIVPDDVLHGLPFAALEIPSEDRNSRFWADRFSLSIVFQLERKNRKRPSPGSKPLLIGVTGTRNGLPQLERAKNQIEWLRKWFQERKHEPDVIVEEETSVSGALERLSQATFFHICCHGEFVQGKPSQTGLLLGPQLEKALSLQQLSRLDLRKLNHASLISCWGADNFILPGRWVLSLPQVILQAGAGTVLASLWEVEEDIAERFVMAYYRNLMNCPADVALQRAQAEIRKSRSKSRDLRYWAGFQIYGDTRHLRF
jgi:CHAT domain-containing protein